MPKKPRLTSQEEPNLKPRRNLYLATILKRVRLKSAKKNAKVKGIRIFLFKAVLVARDEKEAKTLIKLPLPRGLSFLLNHVGYTTPNYGNRPHVLISSVVAPVF